MTELNEAQSAYLAAVKHEWRNRPLLRLPDGQYVIGETTKKELLEAKAILALLGGTE